jgi:two-component system chemotaxis sensor kinase CheA
MDSKDTEFLKRIQATFRIEAEEHMKSFETGLRALERTTGNENSASVIESLFREVHSLKGAARSVGHKEIESVCQPLETLIAGLKKEEILLNAGFFDLFYQSLAILQQISVSEGARQSPGNRENIRDLILQLRQAVPDLKEASLSVPQVPLTEQAVAKIQVVETEAKIAADSNIGTRKGLTEMVRIPVAKLDPLLLQAEEFLQTGISLNQQTNDLNTIRNEVAEWSSEAQKWKVRGSKATMVRWNEWFELNELRLNNLENHLASVCRIAERAQHTFGLLVSDHLDSMKQLLLLPVSSLVESFPSMIREIAREQKKDIGFTISGSEMEIDKRILEELKVPLIHLLRNSIDHGIGTLEERRLQNKPARGNISLKFSAKGSGLVEIAVSDDGKGIQKERVLNSAIKAGILTREAGEKMTDDEVVSLVFHSGLSTSSIITDLSGRGLGLSIVREKVEKLNGRLLLETSDQAGTTFRLILPMTLATFRGILVRLGDAQFILPTMNVERVLRVKPDDILTVENYETLRIEEDILSVVSLAAALGMPERRMATSRPAGPESANPEFLRMVVLISGSGRIAFKVDDVLDEHQVLVKGLGKLLKKVTNFAGATILGTGKIVPVLHVSDLMKSALRAREHTRHEVKDAGPAAQVGRILVAEDSITSRTLLKNILETAGYQVTTAVDGLAAYTKARSDEFDLIVSDVDMPRMNGFELTAKIRSDQKLSEIPVVLVTSLESRDDRERGIDAGANAYIIKSSFDQGNLLEVIKKLI